MKPSEKVLEIKGNWGQGNQAIGNLFCLAEEATLFDLKIEHQGQILALKGKLNRGLWHKATSLGIAGILCGGLPDEAFAQEIAKEVLMVKDEERLVALPLVVVGEKGMVSEETWALLIKNQGKKVVLEGSQSRLLVPKDET